MTPIQIGSTNRDLLHAQIPRTDSAGIPGTRAISAAGVRELLGSGANFQPIPVGQNSPQFSGQEFVIPPSSFSLFDQLRSGGQIVVAPVQEGP